MNRAEHLQWCKDRANEIANTGDYAQAYASMASDLGKHKETENHSAIGLGMSMLMGGLLNSNAAMTNFINGFN